MMKKIAAIIFLLCWAGEAYAGEAPDVFPRGKVVFLGLNNWKIRYEQVLQIAEMLKDRPDIVFITPEEAFAAADSWRRK